MAYTPNFTDMEPGDQTASKALADQLFQNLEDRNLWDNVLTALKLGAQVLGLSPLEYYLRALDSIESIDSLTDEQKAQLKPQLYLTYSLLSEHPEKYATEQIKCKALINYLSGGGSPLTHQTTPKPSQFQKASNLLLSNLDSLQHGINSLSALNNHRLDGVWTMGLIRMVLAALPDDFFYTSNARYVVAALGIILGKMSYQLYFTRLTANLVSSLYTRLGPITQEDRARFKAVHNTTEGKEPDDKEIAGHKLDTDWVDRWYSIENDLRWAPTNKACFSFWTGVGGDLLTQLMLYGDAKATAERAGKTRQKFRTDRTDRLNALRHLEQQPVKSDELSLKIRHLERTYQRNSREWGCHTEKQLNADEDYANKLMIAFGFMILPSAVPLIFAPTAPIQLGLAFLGLVGTLGCAYLSFTFNVQSNHLEEIRSTANKTLLLEYAEENRELIKDPKQNQTLRLVNLMEKKQLEADATYEEQMAFYYQQHMMRSAVLYWVKPLLISGAFVFCPWNVAIALCATTAVIASATYMYLELAIKPEKTVALPSIEDYKKLAMGM